MSIEYLDATADLNTPVFFDRSLIDAVSAWSTLPDYDQQRAEALLTEYRYHDIVFLTPPWREHFEHDAQRQGTFADAVKEYERLLEDWPAAGYTVLEIPQLPIKQRIAWLLQQLKTPTPSGD